MISYPKNGQFYIDENSAFLLDVEVVIDPSQAVKTLSWWATRERMAEPAYPLQEIQNPTFPITITVPHQANITLSTANRDEDRTLTLQFLFTSGAIVHKTYQYTIRANPTVPYFPTTLPDFGSIGGSLP